MPLQTVQLHLLTSKRHHLFSFMAPQQPIKPIISTSTPAAIKIFAALSTSVSPRSTSYSLAATRLQMPTLKTEMPAIYKKRKDDECMVEHAKRKKKKRKLRC